MFDVIVTLFGIAMAVAPLLQVIRMIKLQASDEISIGMFCVLFIGASLWFAYGIEHSLPSIIIANGVGMVVNAMTVLVALYFRQSRITVDITDDTTSDVSKEDTKTTNDGEINVEADASTDTDAVQKTA